MANHVIRDRIWDSKKLARCSREAAMAYPWIFLVADAWGRFEYNPRRIWALVFGGRKDVTEADVEAWLAEYEAQGLLFRYHMDGELGFWVGFYGRASSKRKPSQYPDPAPFMKKAQRSGRTSAADRKQGADRKSGRTLVPQDRDREKEGDRDKEQEVVAFYNSLTGRQLSVEAHRKPIEQRLEQDVSTTVLKLAVIGACLKPFHLGLNDRHMEYLDPETIFRPGRFDGHAEHARRATAAIPGAVDVWRFWGERLKLQRPEVMRHFFDARDRLLVEEGKPPLGAAALGDAQHGLPKAGPWEQAG